MQELIPSRFFFSPPVGIFPHKNKNKKKNKKHYRENLMASKRENSFSIFASYFSNQKKKKII